MKKRALRKDFYMEVRGSLNRFISIMLIVALGVAFYSGIHSSQPDMKYSGDQYFDEHNLMDLKVIGTMGLTKDDVAALSQLDGIAKVEPGYMNDVLCGEEIQRVVHLETISPTLNRLTPVEGRLPEKSGECFVDIEFLRECGYQIGDSITFYRDEEDDLMLKQDTFTIVGAGSSPLYISFERGNTNLGSGTVDGTGYILTEDFDSEVYTQIYMEVKGADSLTAYTDAYDLLIEEVLSSVEAIAGERCEVRYEEVISEANEEIADAKKELEEGRLEGESELADAKAELKEAESEIVDGWAELEDAKKELAEGESELVDGEKEIEENKVTIAENEQELLDGESQIHDGWAQLNSGKQELASQEKKFNKAYPSAMAEIESGEAQLADAKTQLAAARQQYEAGVTEYEAGKAQYEAGEAAYASGLEELEAQEAAWPAQKAELESQKAGLETQKAELEAQRSALETQKTELAVQRTELESQKAPLAAQKAELEAQKTDLVNQKAALETQRAEQVNNQAQLEAVIPQIQSQIDGANAGLADANQRLSAAQQEVNNKSTAVAEAQGKVSSLEGQKSALDSEITSLQSSFGAETDEEKKQELQSQIDSKKSQRDQIVNTELPTAQAELSARNSELSQAQGNVAAIEGEIASLNGSIPVLQEQLNQQNQNLQSVKEGIVQLDSGISQIDAGLIPLEEGLTQVDGGIAQLDSGIAQIDSGVAEIDGGIAQLSEGITQLDSGISQIIAGIAQGDQGLAAGRQQITETRTQLDAAKAEVEAGAKTLEESRQQLEAGEKELASNEKKLSKGRKQLEDGKKEIEKAKQTIAANEQTLISSQAELEDGRRQLEEGKQKLAEAESELADAKREIADGKQEILEAESELAEGESELADGWIEYEDGVKEFESEIAEAESEIAEAESEIADLKEPEWMVNDRGSLPENIGYGENADRMKSLGRVFPVMFFLVAALISLTTMTRMVEEQRTQIGTMKALGYSKVAIASKYMLYALFATLAGSVLGVLGGQKLIPYVIVMAYKIVYHHIPNVVLPYNMEHAFVATGAALFCTLFATFSACYRELASTPAVLMRPPAPKEGKRVFLEYVPFVWKHLSFSWKSTIRNLFRYKKRFFMTIFGIGGCMALMLVGYGLRDSIMDIANIQYKQIQTYDGMVIMDEDASAAEKKELLSVVQKEPRIESELQIFMEKEEVPVGRKNWTLYMMVPEAVEKADAFLTFRDRISGETYELTDEGAIVTEKIAREAGVSVGDHIIVKNDDFGEVSIPIAQITENYMAHYIYLTPALYEQCFGKSVSMNQILYRVNEDAKSDVTELGEMFLAEDASLSISYTANTMASINDMLVALDSVMIVLIISAGLLAFIVLYNLNNINVNERKRELATLKVLGFFDGEVSAYVYRENILITILGIFAGVGLGILLHRFTIITVEVDNTMFGRNINLPSFLTAAAFTAIFSIIVNVVMHFKLKKIDMVESLKSVE